jgi:phosphoglucomutase
MTAHTGIEEKIDKARARGQLLESTTENIRALLTGAPSDLYGRAIEELIATEAWAELNDRFYKTLAFGTGGLRGRTIGKIVTKAERGKAGPDEPPQFPCVGTNAMNFYNVSRATQGLVAYLHGWQSRSDNSPSLGDSVVRLSQTRSSALTGAARPSLPAGERAKAGVRVKPKLVIAHDTRFFSKEFCELAATVAIESGCDAFVFNGPRSTPELSFAVRHLRASAGIVITASHNPPHDNGYKVYFNDGAQVVEPHASGIIANVNAVEAETFAPLPQDRRGNLTTLGKEIDESYMRRVETLIVDPSMINEKSLLVVFTPLHGTGGVILKPMFKKLGLNVEVVAEQDVFDGRFPTVKSPNPENAEALRLGIDLAKKKNADLVIATDPDCDRVGVAVRSVASEMKLLTGNQIASLIAYYRVKTLFERGVLNKENASHAVIIKTFVTTDLLKAIAEHYGVRCVETLTGFKYIGQKLGKYERAISEMLRNRPHVNPLSAPPSRDPGEDARAPGEGRRTLKEYVDLSEEESRRLRLEHSSFYVFGGEESYGYSGGDFVRDKDGNGSAIMFCEVAAYAKSQDLTVDRLLDEIFMQFGYFEERNGSLVFEGAEGAGKIAHLVDSYAISPPTEMLGTKVSRIRNFATETIRDVEGDEIPKEKMSIFELEDRTRIAVRASGTEPKIKYYLFGQERPGGGKFTTAQLETIKAKVGKRLQELWNWLQEDARARLV